MSPNPKPETARPVSAPKARKRAASSTQPAKPAKKVSTGRKTTATPAPKRRASKQDVPQKVVSPLKAAEHQPMRENVEALQAEALRQEMGSSKRGSQLPKTDLGFHMTDHTADMKLHIPNHADSVPNVGGGDDSIAQRRAKSHLRMVSQDGLTTAIANNSKMSAPMLDAAAVNMVSPRPVALGHGRSSLQISNYTQLSPYDAQGKHQTMNGNVTPVTQARSMMNQGIGSPDDEISHSKRATQVYLSNQMAVRHNLQHAGPSQIGIMAQQPTLSPETTTLSTGPHGLVNMLQAPCTNQVHSIGANSHQSFPSNSPNSVRHNPNSAMTTARSMLLKQMAPTDGYQVIPLSRQQLPSQIELYTQNLQYIRSQSQGVAANVTGLPKHNMYSSRYALPQSANVQKPTSTQFARELPMQPSNYVAHGTIPPTYVNHKPPLQHRTSPPYGYYQPSSEVPRPLATDVSPANYAGLHWPFYYRTIAINKGQAFYTFTDEELDFLQDTGDLFQAGSGPSLARSSNDVVTAASDMTTGQTLSTAQTPSRNSMITPDL